ncbi:unnamed protein product [Rhizopus microsporus]
MNFLKSTGHSARFMQRRVTLNSLRYTNRARLYSTATGGPVKESSNVPWAIGSLLVFGPILFKLTSPPPPSKRKNLTEHLAPVPVEEEKPAAVEEPVKVIQKPYVLIGAGTASFAAAQAIKEKDPNANVIIIGEEGYAPYMRPPLSKEFWFSEDPKVGETLRFKLARNRTKTIVLTPRKSAIYQDVSEYEIIQDASGSDLESSKIKLLLNKRATKLNVEDHTVTLDDGSVIYYNKVLLATGGEPKRLPMQDKNDKNVTTFRSIEDFKKLEQLAKNGAHIAVVGGGFLGSELAVALAHRGM